MDINLKAKTVVTIDGESVTVKNLAEMFDLLHIPLDEEFRDIRAGIVQKLIAFGELDLSPAYEGHTVTITNTFFEEEDDA